MTCLFQAEIKYEGARNSPRTDPWPLKRRKDDERNQLHACCLPDSSGTDLRTITMMFIGDGDVDNSREVMTTVSLCINIMIR